MPIFRSTRLCVTACGIMHPRCCRPVTIYGNFNSYRYLKTKAEVQKRRIRPSLPYAHIHRCDIIVSMSIYFQITTEKMQRFLIDLFISTDAQHVSGGSSAHHQEHPRCCRPVTAGNIVGALCHKCSQTHFGCFISSGRETS